MEVAPEAALAVSVVSGWSAQSSFPEPGAQLPEARLWRSACTTRPHRE
ncbi:hypothetical protein PCH70_02910 [Pseudomonas cichorii JBC1]|nr:hypothetical protein PCH70_02910 [Pseudomonas cichorii JBC1]